MLQPCSSPLVMEAIHKAIADFAEKVLNIIDDHVYIVNNVNNNVNNVNNVNNNVSNVNIFVDNSVYRPEELDVMQTLLDDWAREALKELQQLIEANGE